jgi:hypothetical protein
LLDLRRVAATRPNTREAEPSTVSRGLPLLPRHRIPHLKLAIEIDGRLHEKDEDLFESDRSRQNALVVDGWRVLRFTWRMLKEHPEVVVAAIRQALLSITDTGLRRRA